MRAPTSVSRVGAAPSEHLSFFDAEGLDSGPREFAPDLEAGPHYASGLLRGGVEVGTAEVGASATCIRPDRIPLVPQV